MTGVHVSVALRLLGGGVPASIAILLLSFSSTSHAGLIYDPSTRSYVEYNQRVSSKRRVPGRYKRQTVRFVSKQPAGTIIIDTRRHYLYYILGKGRAIRYGVGLGRVGFGWKGVVKIGRKQTWPAWTPPKEMIERQPGLARYAGGMPGGPGNPLGARALYLFDGSRDTLYRIHGTNEPWTIGLNISSGCIRLKNEDIKHLHKQARIGAKVIVR